MSIGYYNGKFLPVSEVKIPLTDRALFFGEGVYEALIALDGIPHLAERHIERLFYNLSLVAIPFDKTKEEMLSLIKEAILLSGERCALVYLQVTAYSERRIHSAPKTEKYNLLITVTDCPMPDVNKRLRLVTYPDLRYRYCNIKTLNLLPSVFASNYAQKNGADEAVFIRDNTVTECSKSNIFAVKDGIVYTHPCCELILPGIARELLLNECRRLKIPKREEPFSKEMLYSADALIVTSSTKICSLAESVDGMPFGNGCEVAKTLCENLHNNFIKSCI